MFSSYHIALNAFIKASCINDIHICERLFAAVTFKGLFLFRQSNKVYNILWSVRVFFAFLSQIVTGYGKKIWFSICRHLVWRVKV